MKGGSELFYYAVSLCSLGSYPHLALFLLCPLMSLGKKIPKSGLNTQLSGATEKWVGVSTSCGEGPGMIPRHRDLAKVCSITRSCDWSQAAPRGLHVCIVTPWGGLTPQHLPFVFQGNDQVRFELSCYALCPKIKVRHPNSSPASPLPGSWWEFCFNTDANGPASL